MFRYAISFTLWVLFATTSHASAVPRVVVSIAPVHSLVVGVMDGVAEPVLLVRGNSSPHGYRLKPSQVRSLQRADLIIWVGESVEGFLQRPLANYDESKTIVELMNVKAMHLISAREGGGWPAAKEEGHHHNYAQIDGHLWLDPQNAKVIVKQVVATLSKLDSTRAAIYTDNGQRMQQALTELDQLLKQTLAAVSHTPYLVFHDAYQYFEQRYGLASLAAVISAAEHKPGAKRISRVRELAKTEQVHCVFSEPQLPSKLISIITEGSNLKSATLDPMGMGLKPGQSLYFDLMKKLGQDLLGCLEG